MINILYHNRGLNLIKSISLLFFIPFIAGAQAPVANFTASPLAGCSPLIVNFQDQSTNATAWSWDFGNGATSSSQNPTTTYFNPGTYTVKLTAANATSSNTLTRTAYITVYENPQVDFTADKTGGCFPLPVQFTDITNAGAGNTPASWEWSFGDGTTSTVQNPLHKYATTGNYPVTLKVTTDKGCFKTIVKQQYIQVTPGVSVDFSNTSPNVCHPPVDISFTNSSSGPGNLTYTWRFGDGGNSTVLNPAHTYNSPGNFTVTLIATSDQGCLDSLVRPNAVRIDTINTIFSAPDSICINDSVSFINTSTPAPASASWNFGDGTVSSVINPTKAYSVSGNYTVHLLNNFGSCQDSATKTIRVVSLPVPDFSADKMIGCQAPLTVQFQDLSAGNASSWFWDFGDSSSSTLQNPSHVYTGYGVYTVTLIATNSLGCTDTVIKNQFIKIVKPIINLPGLPVQGCIPLAVNFSSNISTADAVTSYLWNFGDGNTSTLPNPSHTYTVLGTYTVSLTITTSTGCTEVKTVSNAVKAGTPPPSVDFTAAPTTTCVDKPIQFTDHSVTVDSWLWEFGNGAVSVLQNPVYQYPQPGTYTVKLTARNSGCPVTETKTDYITILSPRASFTYASNCNQKTEFQFTDQSDSASSWLWNFGDGTTSILQNPVHGFPGLGTYTVTLTVVYGSCEHSFSRTIRVVNELPDINVSSAITCKKNAVLFSAAGVNNSNIINYKWDLGNGQIINGGGSVNYAYQLPGNYTVSLVVTDLNGCKDSVAKTNFIRVNGPAAGFSGTDTTGCKGLTTRFNDLSTSDGVNPITSWKWDFGDGSIQTFTAPPFQHVYADTGTFSVTLYATDASGCTDSIRKVNFVKTSGLSLTMTSPHVLSCPGAPVTFYTTMKGNGTSFLWDYGDGTTSTLRALNTTHNYLTNGLYTVKLMVSDSLGCADSVILTNYIRVDTPAANFVMDDSISSCTPFEVHFTNTSSYFINQTWDFGDGQTSGSRDPSNLYFTPGNYTVRLIAQSGGGCRDTVFKTVTLYDTVGTKISYNPLAGCLPLPVTLTATTKGPLSYLWDFGDGITLSSNTNPLQHTYHAFGDFVPKLILEDQTGCLIPVTGTDTIRIVGALSKFGADKLLLCDSGLVNFIDSTTFNDPVTSYAWDFGDGNSSSLQEPSHYYASPGLYTVSLTVQTQGGCADTSRRTGYIAVVSSPLIDISSDPSSCLNVPLALQGIFLRSDTSQVNWYWDFGDAHTATVQNPDPHVYASPGNYTVNVIAINSSGCADTASKNIRIHPLPTVTLPTILPLNVGFSIPIPAEYSGNMNSYTWSPANGLSCTDCPQPVASPVRTTQYDVIVVDSNSCEGRGSILIKVFCENSNVFMPNTFSPNNDGRNDIFYPRGKGLSNIKTLRIFNRWGEVVFEKHNFPANDPSSGWDGNFKGKPAGNGVYVYQFEVYCQNGELITFDGNVALIR